MTTTLPAVSQSGSKSLTTLPGLARPQRSGRSNKSNKSNHVKSHRHSIGKIAGIDKEDISAYRNSYKHNLSLEILQDGYVTSFIELFQLFEKQKEDRESAGCDSGIHEVPLLIDQHEKLDTLKHKLIEAEQARRAGAPEKAYSSYLDLAKYFEEFPSDQWLIDHFHSKCMEQSVRVEGDGGRKQAEANFNIGLALEKRGDLTTAVEYLEKFYNLTMEQEWQDKIGDNLHDIAALQLYRTYSCLAEEVYEISSSLSIEYLKKAYHMANEGGNRAEAGKASHRLGNIYEAVGDPEVATMYHKGYLDRCKREKDKIGMGKAYEALARCQQSEGNLEGAVENYKEFVKITEELPEKDVYSQACGSLATLYNMLGEYNSAVEYYKKAGEASETKDKERIDLMNIQQAIAKSHSQLVDYSKVIIHNSPKLTATLVEWKDYRDESFVSASRPTTRNESVLSGSGQNTPAGDTPIPDKKPECKSSSTE